jgi:transcriptional regulator with XRE-family HTH domain
MEAPLNVAKTFGERVREKRRARKLTQVQVAERAGMFQHHISQLENGEVMPTLETILKLAAAIGCKPTDLLSPFNGIDLGALLDR